MTFILKEPSLFSKIAICVCFVILIVTIIIGTRDKSANQGKEVKE